MAAYANNSGGYILFGIQDSPREIIGLKNDNFENLQHEQFTEAINALFAPAMEWDMGIVLVDEQTTDDTVDEKIMTILENKQAIFNAFADKSVAAAESMELDDKTFGNIIKEEIDRINEKYGKATEAAKAGST